MHDRPKNEDFHGPAIAFAGLLFSIANVQQASVPVKVVQLTGLVGIKDNAKGTLTVEKGALILRTRREAPT